VKRITVLLLLMCTQVFNGPAQAQQPAAGKETTASKMSSDCSPLQGMRNQLDWDAQQLKDWPRLDRYRAANATVQPPAKDEVRVVFLGDSITAGWSDPQNGGFFPGKSYLNRGIGWQTTPQMVLRFRPDVIALQPQVVVILAGTNDIAGNTGPMTLEETEGNLATMSELAHVHGIRVVLSSVMPVTDGIVNSEGKHIPQTNSRSPGKILALNEWIKKYAAENGDVYLDYFSATVDEKGFLKTDITNDGLHPNAKGYAVMAPLAEKAIQEALKKKAGSAPSR
jgi:lysophospholipase L1-like esterase